MANIKIPVEVSNRHVHLSRKDVDILFGKNYKLRIRRKLSQPGEFAAEEKVDLENDGRVINNVRVIGPERAKTQVELLKSDCKLLGITAPVRESGDLKDTPGLKLVGPKGTIAIKEGVIVAQRHLHCSENDAKKLGLKDKQVIKIRANGIIFDNVFVKLGKKYKLAVHIDKDDGDFAGISRQGYCEIIRQPENKRMNVMTQKKITRQTIIVDAIKVNPDAPQIMFKYGLHCIGCHVSLHETIEQGCMAHGMDEREIGKMIDELNKALKTKTKS